MRHVKPFLLLAIRAEDAAADDEYAAMLRCSGLEERHLRRIRLEQTSLGQVELDEWDYGCIKSRAGRQGP